MAQLTISCKFMTIKYFYTILETSFNKFYLLFYYTNKIMFFEMLMGATGFDGYL